MHMFNALIHPPTWIQLIGQKVCKPGLDS